MTSINPLLVDAEGVQAWYGSSHILRGVDLQLGEGESLGLLGRNGMGKSTLIRTLLGYVKQRSGAIHIGGRGRLPGRAAGGARARGGDRPPGRRRCPPPRRAARPGVGRRPRAPPAARGGRAPGL